MTTPDLPDPTIVDIDPEELRWRLLAEAENRVLLRPLVDRFAKDPDTVVELFMELVRIGIAGVGDATAEVISALLPEGSLSPAEVGALLGPAGAAELVEVEMRGDGDEDAPPTNAWCVYSIPESDLDAMLRDGVRPWLASRLAPPRPWTSEEQAILDAAAMAIPRPA